MTIFTFHRLNFFLSYLTTWCLRDLNFPTWELSVMEYSTKIWSLAWQLDMYSWNEIRDWNSIREQMTQIEFLLPLACTRKLEPSVRVLVFLFSFLAKIQDFKIKWEKGQVCENFSYVRIFAKHFKVFCIFLTRYFPKRKKFPLKEMWRF